MDKQIKLAGVITHQPNIQSHSLRDLEPEQCPFSGQGDRSRAIDPTPVQVLGPAWGSVRPTGRAANTSR